MKIAERSNSSEQTSTDEKPTKTEGKFSPTTKISPAILEGSFSSWKSTKQIQAHGKSPSFPRGKWLSEHVEVLFLEKCNHRLRQMSAWKEMKRDIEWIIWVGFVDFVSFLIFANMVNHWREKNILMRLIWRIRMLSFKITRKIFDATLSSVLFTWKSSFVVHFSGRLIYLFTKAKKSNNDEMLQVVNSGRVDAKNR